MKSWANHLVLLALGGLLSMSGGCAAKEVAQFDSWGTEFEVRFGIGDESSDIGPPDDSASKSDLGDQQAQKQDAVEQVGGPDLDVTPPQDLVIELDQGQLQDEVSDSAALPDHTDPDLKPQDLEQPEEIVVTYCGSVACSAEKPLCKLGKCSCDAVAGTCPSGTFCLASGECLPCSTSSHCGPQCEDCDDLSGNFFCANDASGCVECDSEFGCLLGKTCVEGACVPCSTLGLCGLYCLQCSGKTPDCVGGGCACNSTSCGPSEVCEYGACVACTASDPLHCGPSCAKCGVSIPHCKSGTCTLCNTNGSCGPSCQACPSGTPVCRPDGAGCVQCLYQSDCLPGLFCTPLATCGQCLNDTHCLPAEYCGGGFRCLPDKPLTACPGDLAPTGLTCANAKIIGRTSVAGIEKTFDGATTWNGTNYDDVSCDDTGSEMFYRIYLEPGDKVDLYADPNSSYYDLVLKVYRGSDCDDNGYSDLVVCKDLSLAYSAESYSFQVMTVGWYTIVIDGAGADSSNDDYGPYSLDVKVTCLQASCNCP